MDIIGIYRYPIGYDPTVHAIEVTFLQTCDRPTGLELNCPKVKMRSFGVGHWIS